MNFSTDGDPSRRQIFDSLMSHEIGENSLIFPIISELMLIDTNVGENDETVNFDPKHLCKRIRTFIIGSNFYIGKDNLVLKEDISKILNSTSSSEKYSNESLLNPVDKQNVPLAVEFLNQFCKAVRQKDKVKSLSFKLSCVFEFLYLFTFVIEGVLVTFTNPSISIEEQLEKTSQAAHILMILKHKLEKFLPNQLYYDIQATFKDAFFCSAKWKVHHPEEPFFLMLCSNDVLERFFGCLRLKYKFCSIDNLEILYASRSMVFISF